MHNRMFGRLKMREQLIRRSIRALHALFFVVVCLLGFSVAVAQNTGGGFADPAYDATASQGLTRIEQRVALLFAIELSLSEPNPVVPPPEGLEAVSLIQASEYVYSSAQQRNIVLAFWEASVNRAVAHVEQRRADYLGNAAPAVVETEAKILLAQSDAEAALIEYQTAQLVLLEQSMLGGADTLSPSPSDLPYVGDYETKLDYLRATRSVSRRAIALSRRLPLERRLIESRSRACDAAEVIRSTAYEAYVQKRITFEAYAETVETVRDAELAFVDSVGRYNRTIVGYATETLGLELHGRMFIQMLIPLPDSEPGPYCDQASPDGTLSPQPESGLSGSTGGDVGRANEPITSTPMGAAAGVDAGSLPASATSPTPNSENTPYRYRQPGLYGGESVPLPRGVINDPSSGPSMPDEPF
jgi:hypothetical protein